MSRFDAAGQQPTPTGNGVDVIDVVKGDVLARGRIEGENAAFRLIDPYLYFVWLAAELRLKLGSIEPGTTVYEAVASDLEHRAVAGTKKYGRRLHTQNGRNAKYDSYQELLDLLNFVCQDRLEGKGF